MNLSRPFLLPTTLSIARRIVSTASNQAKPHFSLKTFSEMEAFLILNKYFKTLPSDPLYKQALLFRYPSYDFDAPTLPIDFKNVASLKISYSDSKVQGWMELFFDSQEKQTEFMCYVDPRYQNLGLGKHLFEAALKESTSLGASTMSALVMARNYPCQKFMQKMCLLHQGYQDTGKNEDPFNTGPPFFEYKFPIKMQ